MASQEPPAVPIKPLKLQRVAGMTLAKVRAAVAGGSRFVIFPYCESFAVITFRRATDPILVHPGESRLRVSGAPILHSLLLGWWGIPWGPIWTVTSLWRTLQGGIDVTDEVVAHLELAFAGRQLEPVSKR
jgi:hypothetical protein